MRLDKISGRSAMSGAVAPAQEMRGWLRTIVRARTDEKLLHSIERIGRELRIEPRRVKSFYYGEAARVDAHEYLAVRDWYARECARVSARLAHESAVFAALCAEFQEDRCR